VRNVERAFVWAGGGAFVSSLALCVWSYAVWMSAPAPWRGWRPVAINAALFVIFAAHHSVFARERPKRWLAAIPRRLLRSVYVWIASMLLVLVCLSWQPVGGELYRAPSLFAVALTLIQLAGFWIIARAVAQIDPLELAGIRVEPTSAGSQPPAGPSALQIAGPYRWVRHPVYFGWILIVFGAAHMTGDRLAFAVISSIYLILAVPWEERSLRQSFGEDYVRYMQQVRWRVLPYMY
jgi:protein-S-isoprenylcysteine O-methyltransferase Ste14